jgi:hypothetical protein
MPGMKTDPSVHDHSNSSEQPVVRTCHHPLTSDELHAAEAAFQGLPFNPGWPRSAQDIYFGMVTALASCRHPTGVRYHGVTYSRAPSSGYGI